MEPGNLTAHNLVEKHRLASNFSDWVRVNCTISPDDDIFRFFRNHPSSLNPVRDYLADGWRSLAELQRIMEAIDLKLSTCTSFLEFASGFGRFTRHLATVLPRGSLYVSDVVPGSVTFAREQFGVEGFYSTTDPAALNPGKQFQIIFVLSLFSHLPRATWGAWLERLYQLLAPGGTLIFSTHGEKCARLQKVSMPADGFAFFPSSESHALPGHEYGVSFTSESFVRAAISALNPQAVRFFPAHFWGNQDGFAVTRAA